MDFSQKLDPKNFATFEEYKMARELQKEFQAHVRMTEKISQESQSEEEFNERMEAAGFQTIEDINLPPEMEMMLDLQGVQQIYAEICFEQLLPPEQYLIDPMAEDMTLDFSNIFKKEEKLLRSFLDFNEEYLEKNLDNTVLGRALFLWVSNKVHNRDLTKQEKILRDICAKDLRGKQKKDLLAFLSQEQKELTEKTS